MLDVGSYEIVYAIIKKKPAGKGKWQLTLPFFAKLNLMKAASQLQNQGYKVRVKLIERKQSPKSTSGKAS